MQNRNKLTLARRVFPVPGGPVKRIPEKRSILGSLDDKQQTTNFQCALKSKNTASNYWTSKFISISCNENK